MGILTANVIKIQDTYSLDKFLGYPLFDSVFNEIEISFILVILEMVWGQKGPGILSTKLHEQVDEP